MNENDLTTAASEGDIDLMKKLLLEKVEKNTYNISIETMSVNQKTLKNKLLYIVQLETTN